MSITRPITTFKCLLMIHITQLDTTSHLLIHITQPDTTSHRLIHITQKVTQGAVQNEQELAQVQMLVTAICVQTMHMKIATAIVFVMITGPMTIVVYIKDLVIADVMAVMVLRQLIV